MFNSKYNVMLSTDNSAFDSIHDNADYVNLAPINSKSYNDDINKVKVVASKSKLLKKQTNCNRKQKKLSVDEKELQDALSRLIEEASLTYALGDIEKALHIYNQLISIDPTNNVLFSNRSAILLKLGHLTEALLDAEQSIRLKPDWSKAYFRKAEVLKEFGDFEKAIWFYAESLKLSPEIDQFRVGLINCIGVSSFKDQFSTAFNSMKSLGYETNIFLLIVTIAQFLLNDANNCENKAEKIDNAIHLLEIAIAVNENSELTTCYAIRQSVYGAISNAYYTKKNFKKFFHFSELQLQLAKQSGDLQLQLSLCSNIAEIAMQNDDYSKAKFYQNIEIELLKQFEDPNINEVKLKHGEILLLSGDYVAAETMFREIISIDSFKIEALYGLGRALFYLNNFSGASQFFKQIEQLKLKDEKSETEICRLETTIFKCKCIMSEAMLTVNCISETATKVIQILENKFDNNILTKLEAERPDILGNLYGLQSSVYRLLSNGRLAWKYACLELKFAFASKNLFLRVDALFQLSQICIENKKFENAKIFGGKLNDLVNENSVLNTMVWRKNILLLFANIYGKINNFEKAAKYIEELLKLSSDSAIVIKLRFRLVRLYAKLNEQENREIHINVLKDLIFDENADTVSNYLAKPLSLKNEMLWHEAYGVFLYKNKKDSLKTIVFHFEKALMLAQELENCEKEAHFCEKLGLIYLEFSDSTELIKASATYFRQFLSISQQMRNVEAILRAYSNISRAYLKMKLDDEALESLKFELTLSKLLNRPSQQLHAMLSIGRIFLYQRNNFKLALKLFQKAKKIVEKLGVKREGALCYGYLAECYLGIGEKSMAMHCFCEQLLLFAYVKDTEGKCEAIRHLIEEKKSKNDEIWCLRLCQMRRKIVEQAHYTLKIDVICYSINILREFYLKKVNKTFCELKKGFGDLNFNDYVINAEDSTLIERIGFELFDSANEALKICIKHNLPEVFTILIEVCDVFELMELRFKSVQILYTFLQFYYGYWQSGDFSTVLDNNCNSIEHILQVIIHRICRLLIQLNCPSTCLKFVTKLFAEKFFDCVPNETESERLDISTLWNNFKENYYLSQVMSNVHFLLKNRDQALKYFEEMCLMENTQALSCHDFERFYINWAQNLTENIKIQCLQNLAMMRSELDSLVFKNHKDHHLHKYLSKLNLYSILVDLPSSKILNGIARIHFEIWMENYDYAETLMRLYFMPLAQTVDFLASAKQLHSFDNSVMQIFKENNILNYAKIDVELLILQLLNAKNNDNVVNYDFDKKESENDFFKSCNREASIFNTLENQKSLRLWTFLKILQIMSTNQSLIKAIFFAEKFTCRKLVSQRSCTKNAFSEFCNYFSQKKNNTCVFYEFRWCNFRLLWHKKAGSGDQMSTYYSINQNQSRLKDVYTWKSMNLFYENIVQRIMSIMPQLIFLEDVDEFILRNYHPENDFHCVGNFSFWLNANVSRLSIGASKTEFTWALLPYFHTRHKYRLSLQEMTNEKELIERMEAINLTPCDDDTERSSVIVVVSNKENLDLHATKNFLVIPVINQEQTNISSYKEKINFVEDEKIFYFLKNTKITEKIQNAQFLLVSGCESIIPPAVLYNCNYLAPKQELIVFMLPYSCNFFSKNENMLVLQENVCCALTSGVKFVVIATFHENNSKQKFYTQLKSISNALTNLIDKMTSIAEIKNICNNYFHQYIVYGHHSMKLCTDSNLKKNITNQCKKYASEMEDLIDNFQTDHLRSATSVSEITQLIQTFNQNQLIENKGWRRAPRPKKRTKTFSMCILDDQNSLIRPFRNNSCHNIGEKNKITRKSVRSCKNQHIRHELEAYEQTDDLTDTESVSGARVIGFDYNDKNGVENDYIDINDEKNNCSFV